MDLDRSLDATVSRHPAGSARTSAQKSDGKSAGKSAGKLPRFDRSGRLTPESAAVIAARSVCPTCDGREPGPDEEQYATCIFCATGTQRPVLPDEETAALVEARLDASGEAKEAAVIAFPITARSEQLTLPIPAPERRRPRIPFASNDEPLALD